MHIALHGLRGVSTVAGCSRTTTSSNTVPLIPQGVACRAYRPPFGCVQSVAPRAAATAHAAPTGAAAVVNHPQQVLNEIAVPKDAPQRKLVVAQIAPAVRVAIAESFGLAPGSTSPGQLVEALRRLGFDVVFDTSFAADVTIMEEGHELLHRLEAHLEAHPHDNEPMPMFTSCCPGWIGLMEKSYPELIPYVSTTKSPQMIMGSLVKTYFAEKQGIKPSDICMVSIMPCVRKQGEADRSWFCLEEDEGEPAAREVDHVITTAELGAILKEKSINLPELPESEFDNPIGTGTGAGVLFGTTGGVMEAALRTAYEVVTAKPLERLNYAEVRGMDGIKEAQVKMVPAAGSKFADLVAARAAHKAEQEVEAAKAGPIKWESGFSEDNKDGLTLRIAVANGLGNAKKLITKMQAGEAQYDFVEIMACPAGCVGGGGQPRSTDKQATLKRQQAIYALDDRANVRRPHENPAVQQVYGEFLTEGPLGHKAHELLHTHYVAGGAEAE